MNIKKLTEYKGASRFGSCIKCGECESDTHRLYRLDFYSGTICLCTDCFRQTRIRMNNISLDGYKGYNSEMEAEK